MYILSGRVYMQCTFLILAHTHHGQIYTMAANHACECGRSKECARIRRIGGKGSVKGGGGCSHVCPSSSACPRRCARPSAWPENKTGHTKTASDSRQGRGRAPRARSSHFRGTKRGRCHKTITGGERGKARTRNRLPTRPTAFFTAGCSALRSTGSGGDGSPPAGMAPRSAAQRRGGMGKKTTPPRARRRRRLLGDDPLPLALKSPTANRCEYTIRLGMQRRFSLVDWVGQWVEGGGEMTDAANF